MTRRVETMMWVGLFAAPVAFATEHVLGWAISEANCEVVGRQWGISFTTWAGLLAGAAALMAAGGLVSAGLSYRAISGTGNDDPPPEGRVWLLSICGIVVSSVLLVLILLTLAGTLLLGHCHQG